MTIRQICSLFISCIMFGHTMKLLAWVAVTLVFTVVGMSLPLWLLCFYYDSDDNNNNADEYTNLCLLSASCSFYSYTPHLSISILHYTLIVIILITLMMFIILGVRIRRQMLKARPDASGSDSANGNTEMKPMAVDTSANK
jgi:hypothetical protein